VELTRLFVSPERRRHGIGAALVDAVVDYARQRHSGLVLVVVHDRSGTLSFHERQGWRFTKRSSAGWRLADGSRPTLAHFEYPSR
jgi:GNAT superfamily N-acetyltransferase